MAKSVSGQKPKIRAGWKKIGLQVPEELDRLLAETRAAMPFDSVKVVGTAALALFCGLDRATQEALFKWAHAQDLDPGNIKPADAHHILMLAIRNMQRTPLIDSENPKPTVPGEKRAPSPSGGATTLKVYERPVKHPDGSTEEVVRELEVRPPGPEPPAKGRKKKSG